MTSLIVQSRTRDCSIGRAQRAGNENKWRELLGRRFKKLPDHRDSGDTVVVFDPVPEIRNDALTQNVRFRFTGETLGKVLLRRCNADA